MCESLAVAATVVLPHRRCSPEGCPGASKRTDVDYVACQNVESQTSRHRNELGIDHIRGGRRSKEQPNLPSVRVFYRREKRLGQRVAAIDADEETCVKNHRS